MKLSVLLVACFIAQATALMSCAEFCTEAMAVCNATTVEAFSSYDACVGACAFWTPGNESTDVTVNTRGCREYHLQVASISDANRNEHCPHVSTASSECGGECEGYCDVVLGACSGAQPQFASHALCMAACDIGMPVGTFGATSGNSVHCRGYHATVAATGPSDANVHCPHAGFDGGGVCGTSRCETFCENTNTICGAEYPYSDVPECTTECAAYTVGSPTQTDGDTLGCRTYHATVAASDPGTTESVHCPHTSVDSSVCVDPVGFDCSAFCTTAMTNCAGEFYPFATDSCEESCLSHPTGSAGDTSTNTKTCREHYLGEAATTPNASCPAIATASSMCGTYCEGYCDLVMDACIGENMQYMSRTACLQLCALEVTGTLGNTTGDSVQCRAYHSEVASNPVNAEVHCPHAGPMGGDVCGSNCHNFCDLVMEACTSTLYPYIDNDDCLAKCAEYEIGNPTDTADNTLGCRFYHASVALDDPITHCNHTAFDSPVCVSEEQIFCMGVEETCEPDVYGSYESCVTVVAHLPRGLDTDTTENTLGCRIYHLNAANGPEPDANRTHCNHTALASNVCGTSLPKRECDGYCSAVMGVCGSDGPTAQYATEAQCINTCQAMPTGALGENAGATPPENSIFCRAYHAEVASLSLLNAETHCPHAGPLGAGQCGTNCDNFCYLVEQACGAINPFASNAQCLADCSASFTVLGQPIDTTGNTLGCRMYHATAAFDDAATHCPHTAVDSPVCVNVGTTGNPNGGTTGGSSGGETSSASTVTLSTLAVAICVVSVLFA